MKKSLLLTASVALLALPVVALAHDGVVHDTVSVTTGVTTGVSATVTAASVHAEITGSTNVAVEMKAKDRADAEIDRRIANLNNALTRVGEMKKLSDQDKASIQATVNAQITALTTLKAKIDADTVLDDLKTDVKSITIGYRIYVLLLPQVRTVAAADRIVTIVAEMNALEVKLAARIAAFTGDKSALIEADTELKGKIVDANTQAQAAASAVVALQPDNGDKAKMAANMAVLKDAQAKIKIAIQDLADARQDIGKILGGLKGAGAGVQSQGSASTTVQGQGQ